MTTALATADLRTIRVYGTLARLIGRRELRAVVSSVPEALRFLMANFPQVEGHLKGRFFKVKVADWALTQNDLDAPIGQTEDIHIIPAICGAGGDGPLVGILAGAALIGVGLLVPFGGSVLVPLGLGLLLNGVAALLSPTPEVADKDNDPARSYNFSGIQQTSREGVPVPLVYGDIVTGSVVLSVNIERDDEKLGAGDGEGIFEPGIGDNTYNLAERYPGICWGYYSQVYYVYDPVCGCPSPPCSLELTTTLIMIPSWGLAPNANGFYEASTPIPQLVGRGPGQATPSGCGGVKRGYSFTWTDYAPRCASDNNDANRYFENITYEYGKVPVGYRVWQGPAKLLDGTTPIGVPFRLIASTAATGFTIPTETFSSNYPNNPFE